MPLPLQSETRTCARLKNVDKRSPSSTRVSQTVIGTRGEYGVLVRTFDLFDNGHAVYKEALTYRSTLKCLRFTPFVLLMKYSQGRRITLSHF